MVALGVALGLVPVRVLLDLLHNVNRIDMFHISHEGTASSQHHGGTASSHGGAASSHGIQDAPASRWNALHEALNKREWKNALSWMEYMSSSDELVHTVAGLVLLLQVWLSSILCRPLVVCTLQEFVVFIGFEPPTHHHPESYVSREFHLAPFQIDNSWLSTFASVRADRCG